MEIFKKPFGFSSNGSTVFHRRQCPQLCTNGIGVGKANGGEKADLLPHW
ncbi:hypothetical protein ES332_A01G134000v1 [Gossypium tomentosum]|uniref:Uncharacterized protein n=1 Tax=Gossypium tomentosum TaxID=34277 RepID=A0A5D2RR38_GOSTO|nr:hypothetical protein ES332_A01G134000v1 [Gossypium tomentosum]